MGGKLTTIRAPQDAKVERELHKIIARNATDTQLAQAKVELPGTTFEIVGITYRVSEVYRDSLLRLIAVGQLER